MLVSAYNVYNSTVLYFIDNNKLTGILQMLLFVNLIFTTKHF